MKRFAVILATAASLAAGTLPPVSLLEDLSYSRRIWQSRDGLPEDSVRDFAQTSDGYLWIASSGGLVRFDGARFTTFSPANEPAFRDDSVYSLRASRDGSLWVGTEGGGLVHYERGRFRQYGFAEGLTNVYVRTIYEDSKGTLWVGTDKGLFRKDGEKFIRLDARDGIPPLSLHAICEDSQGRILAGGTGLIAISPGKVEQFVVKRADDYIRTLYEDRSGVLWFGTVSALRRIEGGLKKDPFAVPTTLDVPIRGLTDAPDGIWIGTSGSGVLRWSGGRFVRLTAPDGVPHDNIMGLSSDREGNIWVGTQAGLARISAGVSRTLRSSPGSGESFYTVYADKTGSMLAASQAGKMYEVRANQLAPLAIPPSISSVTFRSAFRSGDGSLWLGTVGQGIYQLRDGSVVRHISVPDGLINDFTRAWCEDRDGSLWVGTNGGVSHIVNGRVVKSYNVDNGLAYNSVRDVTRDRNNVIWVATDAGITRIEGDHFVEDHKLDKLRGLKVWTLHEDNTGGMWIGTNGTGLYLFRDGVLTRFPGKEGLPEKIHFIAEDNRGNLWLTSTVGIVSVARINLENFAKNGSAALAARLYNTSDGLATNQMNGGIQSAGAISRSGELWAPSSAGLVVVSPAANRPTVVPPLLLEQAIAGDDVLPVVQEPSGVVLPVEIQPGDGKLELHYTAIRLRSPERLRFRYWMEGAEPGWNQVGDRRVAYFTNLPPGKFRFHVAAWDVDDPSHAVERVFPVVLLPAYYQSWWFMLLVGLMLIGLAWGAYLLHVRNVRRQFVAVLDERTRVAREMHDTVIQGCVGVSALLEAASSLGESTPDLSRVMVERARDEIRTTVEDARSAVWNLRHNVEGGSIQEAIAKLVKRVRTESGIPVDLEATGASSELDSETERGVVLSTREALSNAVRHSGATRIMLKMRFAQEWLSIDVLDNGSGFEWSGEAPGGSRHYGLIGMKERMEKLGGSFDLDTRPGQGTRVRLKVPIPQSV